jgi:ubiquinone/menaquinone biosynthesis C-methylase UbiE
MSGHQRGAWTGWKAWAYALLHRRPATGRAVVEWARLQPDWRVLDIGCGTGAAVTAAARLLNQGSATGIDPSPDFIRIARRRSRALPNVSFEVAAAEEIPFPAGHFDLAWSVHSTHHWHHPARGFAEACRVLRAGGRLLVIERHVDDRPWGISIAQAEALAADLAAAGFAKVAVEERRLGRAREHLITARTPEV